MRYPIVVRPIPEDEGGGYLALFPDLVGCVSDGETPEEALANARLALDEWMETNRRHGRNIPEPGSSVKRALQRQHAMTKALAALASAFSDVDGRIEGLETDLAELKEQIEHASSWMRFSELTAAAPDEAMPRSGQSQLC